MEILKILTLRGPNFWSRRPALEAWVDLQELKDSPSNTLPGFPERLSAWLPTLIEHRCSIGERGGFLQRLRDGTWPGHILEHVTLELQSLAGTPVGFGKARETSTEGVYKVVVRYEEEELGKACLHAARELVLAAIHDRPFDVAAEVKRLRALADSVCLGPSTAAIVAAARARNIPARRLNRGSLVQLGHGCRQRRVWTAETDRTGAIGESIAQDKELTKQLLRTVGVPVPQGRLAEGPADAWAAAEEVGVPVVVKPLDANHGRGVFTHLTTRALVETAFTHAAKEGSAVLVERFIPGSEHRLLVVGDRLVAAARGDAAWVLGTGHQTIRQLVDEQLNRDPRRGEGDAYPLSPVEFDATTVLELERQGYGPDSVPAEGVRLLIQRNGNVGTDVTDEVHPSIAEQAVLATRVVGLDVAGLDVVATTLARPLEEQGGAFVEVNAGPGLHMHLQPAVGTPRPVGEAIVENLFPAGENGRVPIACVTGTNGKTTVARLVHHLLRSTGRTVGLACTEGVFLDGRRLERAGGEAQDARALLLSPRLEAAVFESHGGDILRSGLDFDACDVAVVTGIGECDHLGQHWIDTPEQMFTVKRCGVDVVMPTGAAVLKADDPLVARMAELSAGSVIFFALDPAHPVIEGHRAQGKRAAFVRDGQLVLAEGDGEQPLLAVDAIPVTLGGRVAFQVENALAAAAAAWALGLPLETIRAGLASFGPADLPGRCQLFEAGGRTVLVDDCHNASALAAVLAALDRFPAPHRTAVYSTGAKRRDGDLVRQGELLGAGFDRVVLYDDPSASDRPAGAARALLRRGLEGRQRVREVLEISDHRQAIEDALRRARPGDLVVVQTDDVNIEPALRVVGGWVASIVGEEAPIP